MKELVLDIEKLNKVAEPLQFLTEQGPQKEEGNEIIAQIKEIIEADKNILALSAPQIGINKRIFCIRFNDSIKTFINPVITKKAKYEIKPETFISMPGKEILITRPEEITVVYYTDEFKYEENKLLGPAARIFDQHCQLLDGVTPNDLGLVSDVEADGSLADLNEEEISQEITQKYAKIFSGTILRLIRPMVLCQENQRKFCKFFIVELNKWLEERGVYTYHVRPGEYLSKCDMDYMDIIYKPVTEADKNMLVECVEQLPYIINYVNDFGEKQKMIIEGKIIVCRLEN